MADMSAPSKSVVECKICDGRSTHFSAGTVLGKHSVSYFRCETCGFIQTEDPYWLNEAYSEAITASDVGLVGRNLGMARVAQAVILGFFDRDGRFLDYGGGYGLLVRMMRDKGFDFYLTDKFCQNLFAVGFEANEDPPSRYELVTAVELFEHLVEPRVEVEKILNHSRSILFTTLVVPEPAPALDRWWYYGLEHGQHVAIYSRASLHALATHFGLNLYSDGRAFHLLTNKHVSDRLFRILARPRVGAVLSLINRRSFLVQDGERVGSFGKGNAVDASK